MTRLICIALLLAGLVACGRDEAEHDPDRTCYYTRSNPTVTLILPQGIDKCPPGFDAPLG